MSIKIYVECPNCGHDISVELGEHDKQVRAEMLDEVIKLLNSIEYSTYNDDTRRIEHNIKARLTEQLKEKLTNSKIS